MMDTEKITHYALIGHPVGHSLSPFIHSRLFSLRGREGNYTAVDVPPDRLAEELDTLLEQYGGLNVTIPYKEAVIPLLDELCGRAARYRSVNTIAVGADGVRRGYNTDAVGFVRALEGGGIPLAGRVAVLGCGGAGRTLACEAALAGCTVVSVARPSGWERAAALHRDVLALAPQAAHTVALTTDWSDPAGPLAGEFDLLVNATPVGMYPHGADLAAPREAVARAAAVFDAVYNPAVTPLLQCARANGVPAVGGMSMLVWQAAEAHRHWYGAAFTHDELTPLIAQAQEELAAQFGVQA